MFYKAYNLGRMVNVSIIAGGYLSFFHLFYENLLFALLSITVIVGEIYQLDLPHLIFEKDLEQFGNMHRYLRRLTVLMSFLQVAGGLLIMQGVLVLDSSLALNGLILIFINILLIKHATDKMTQYKISRAKINRFGSATMTLSFISILLGMGGHIVLSVLAFLIAFNKTVVKRWNIIKKKNILKAALEVGDRKEVEEKGLLSGWTNLDKSKQENLLFGVLSQSIIVLMFNMPFIDLKLVVGQALSGYVSFDLIFLLVILVVLVLTYIGIKRQWQEWEKCGMPFVILAGLLVYLILNPTSLPLYHGFVEMIPSYDYLKIVGYNFSFTPMFKYLFSVVARALSFLFLGFLFSALIEKKHSLIRSYKQFPIAESKTAVSYFFLIAIGYLLISMVYQMMWPELMLIFYFIFSALLIIVGLMSFGFLLIVTKEQSLELWYYRRHQFKKSLSPTRFLGWMIKNKKISRWHTWPQFGYLLLIGSVALGLSLGMVNLVSPPQETIAFENASEAIRIRDFMSIDGENYSYGWFGFLDVQDYVSVHLKVLSNDTVGFYLKSDNFVSETVLVKGFGNETAKEYYELTPGRYQVIYYNALDGDADKEMTIYMNVLRTPRKSYLIGPETLPLLFTWALFFIRPSYVIAKIK